MFRCAEAEVLASADMRERIERRLKRNMKRRLERCLERRRIGASKMSIGTSSTDGVRMSSHRCFRSHPCEWCGCALASLRAEHRPCRRATSREVGARPIGRRAPERPMPAGRRGRCGFRDRSKACSRRRHRAGAPPRPSRSGAGRARGCVRTGGDPPVGRPTPPPPLGSGEKGWVAATPVSH